MSMANLASITRDRGDPQAAVPMFEAALDVQRGLGDRALAAFTGCGLALALLETSTSDHDRVYSLVSEALASRVALQDHRGIAECFETLAAVPGAREVESLLRAAQALREAGGFARNAAERERWDRVAVGGALVLPAGEDPVLSGLRAAGFRAAAVEP